MSTEAERKQELEKRELLDHQIKSCKSFVDAPKNKAQYRPGAAASFDGLRGMESVKVIEVKGECYGFIYDDARVRIRFLDGNELLCFPGHVIPNRQLSVSALSARVNPVYKWVP